MKNAITTPAYGTGVRAENVTSFSSGRDELDCVTYSLENFLYLEGRRQGQVDRTLETLFDYWCQQDGSVPTHFAPFEDIGLDTECIRAIIDVRSQNPMEFTLADHKVCMHTGRADGWRDKPFGRIDTWEEYLRVRALQYNLCRHTGMPSFHEIKHHIDGLTSHFVVLLLPVSARKNGKVEEIYSCVRRLSDNQITEGHA